MKSGNIYESYDMAGELGGDPGSNYLEHVSALQPSAGYKPPCAR